MHTVDTIMTNLATFRVHIAPLGFEIDRIVLPLKQTKADKLWIISQDNNTKDKSAPYLEKIKKECKKMGVEVKVAYSDRLSLSLYSTLTSTTNFLHSFFIFSKYGPDKSAERLS